MPKTIHCKIWIQQERGNHPLQLRDNKETVVEVTKPMASELSERENVRRILELAAEQLPPEKTPGHGGAR